MAKPKKKITVEKTGKTIREQTYTADGWVGINEKKCNVGKGAFTR